MTKNIVTKAECLRCDKVLSMKIDFFTKEIIQPTMSGYFIIPKSYISEKEEEDDTGMMTQNILNAATQYAIDSKWPIKHGDLGRLECECGMIGDSGEYDVYIDSSSMKNAKEFLEKYYKPSDRPSKYSINSFASVEGTYINLKPSYPKSGILVRSESAKKWNEYGKYTGYYRNDGLMIWVEDEDDDGGRFVELECDIDEYGALPPNFTLYEEPHYFEERHWHKDDDKHESHHTAKKSSNVNPYITHNGILWINKVDEMCENIKYKTIESECFRRSRQIEYKSVRIYYTHWIDCRGKLRYIVYDHEFELGDNTGNNVSDIINDFKRLLSEGDGPIQVDLFSENIMDTKKIGFEPLYIRNNNDIW